MNGTVANHSEMLMRNSTPGQTAGGLESAETRTLRLIKPFSPGSKTNNITTYSSAAAQPPFGTVSVWGRFMSRIQR